MYEHVNNIAIFQTDLGTFYNGIDRIVVRYTSSYTVNTYDCLLSCESIPNYGKVY